MALAIIAVNPRYTSDRPSCCMSSVATLKWQLKRQPTRQLKCTVPFTTDHLYYTIINLTWKQLKHTSAVSLQRYKKWVWVIQTAEKSSIITADLLCTVNIHLHCTNDAEWYAGQWWRLVTSKIIIIVKWYFWWTALGQKQRRVSFACVYPV